MKNIAKILCFVLALAAVFTIIGVTAFAEEGTAVAKIGDDEYATLAEAVSNAQADDEIVLLSDVSEVELDISKNITLNLNDKTVTDAYIKIAAEVIIKNGYIKNINESYPLVVNSGKLIIEEVNIEASKSDRAVWVRDNGSLVFNSGSILATKGENNTKTSLIAAIYTSTNSDVTINGGTITVDTPDNQAVGIYGNYNNANVTINGGKISTSGKNYSYGIRVDGNITVTGGDIVTNEKGYAYSNGIRYGYNYALYTALGDVTITGGTITTNSFYGYIVSVGRTYSANDQTVTITGGTFSNDLSEIETTSGGHKAPAMIYENSAADVSATISEGEFTGFSETLIKGDITFEITGGSFESDAIVQYVVPGSVITINSSDVIVLDDGTTAELVAQVGNAKYASLEEALKAITAENNVVDILADITITEAWDNRYTGAKISVPVTINGKGHTIKFACDIADGANYHAPFRFQAEATVKDLTLDLSEAINSKNSTRIRAISTSANLTVEGCTFIGNTAYTNTRAIIFGEGSGAAVGNLVVSITNSTFEGWRRGVTDNENHQDVKSVEISGCEFTNAGVNISAAESITFTGNTVSGAPVAITSYSATNNLEVVATGNTLDADYADQTFINAAVITAQDEFATNAVAKIGDKSYATLKAALNAVAEGETIQLLVGEYEFGNVKFPATLKNVTIKGADNKQTIIKNSKLYSADGNAVHYEGITFDGIIFDSSTILFTGARNGEVIYKNWTITNCEFKNIVATSSVSAVHFNLASDETMENFTFTNNVISNVLGSTDAILPSGLRVNYLTGDIIVTGNNISNVTNNAIQFVNVNADTLIIKDNILASNVAAIANLYNTIATETSITNNQFLIKEGQSAVGNIKNVNLSGNYWNGKAPAKLSVTNICDDYYTTVAQDGTLEGLTAYTPAVKTETHWYTSLQTAVNEADPGDIITVVNASALEEKVTAPDGYMLVETVGDNAEYTYYTLVDKTTTPTPSIGEDGYWYIGGVQTTSIAVPNVTVNEDGNWVINGIVATDENGDPIRAKAVDGFNPIVTFVEDDGVKYWAIDLDGEGGEAPVNTGVKAQAFDGVGIEKIKYVSTAGNVDTYAIVYTDGFTTYFTVTHGLDGAQGPVGPQGEQGLKGEDGLKGDDGKDGNDGSEVVKTAVIVSVVCVVLTLGVLGYRIFRRKSF